MWASLRTFGVDAIRRARSRQALLFVTHIESKRVLVHFQRLRRETEGLLDCFLCVHEPETRHPTQRILPADLRVRRNNSKRYVERRYQEMLAAKRSFNSGYTDLAYLPAMANDQFRFYRYIWMMEYDVDYAGNWASFFTDAMRSSADYVATTIVTRADCEDWYWWSTFRAPPGVALAQQTRSFAPIARFSQRMLDRYRASVTDGSWGGHFEALYPTIALHAGLTVEDLRRGTHYTNTPDDWQLSPGTFVYRPAVAERYYHENQSAFSERGLLYHPVKTAER